MRKLYEDNVQLQTYADNAIEAKTKCRWKWTFEVGTAVFGRYVKCTFENYFSWGSLSATDVQINCRLGHATTMKFKYDETLLIL